MPAASDPAPGGARTFRPLGVRIAVYSLGALLAAVALGVWFALPEAVQNRFTAVQLGTLVVFGLGAFALGHGAARSRVDARREGLVVVNGYVTHRLRWEDVTDVVLGRGSPWAVLRLRDGRNVSALAIQGSDGDRARRQVAELRGLVRRGGPAED